MGGRFIVDAMNVIGSRPDGWWRDRGGALVRLVGRLRRLAVVEGVDVTVVMDGKPAVDLPEGEHGGVRVLYARQGGRNAADHRIVALVEADDDPGGLVVVTSDRELARRVRERGAEVLGPRWLLGRLDEAGGGED